MVNYNKFSNTTNSLINVTPVFFWKIINRKYDKERKGIYPNSKKDSLYAFFSPCSHIIDNIFLGSTYNAADWNLIQKLSIKKIINITQDVPNFYEKEGIEYFNINISDNGLQDLNKDKLIKMLEFVNKGEKKNILIHCLVGRSRSVSGLCYILNKKYDKSIEESLIFIKKKRKYANPSLRFYNNLLLHCKK